MPVASLRRRGPVAASRPSAAPAPAVERARREALTVGAYKPNATNTGTLQDPTTLPTTINGDVIMTTDGQVLENTIVNGYVEMRGNDQIVRNCYIVGPVTPSGGARGLITCFGTGDFPKRALIEDCWINVQTPYINYNAVTGHDYIAKRVRGSRTSDGFGVFNNIAPNTSCATQILGCWVEPMAKFWPGVTGTAPNGSHNDCIQIQGGVGVGNIVVRGNLLEGYISQDPAVGDTGGVDVDNSGNPLVPTSTVTNSAIQLNQNSGNLSGLVIEDNWLYGGAIGLNGLAITSTVNLGSFKRNKFSHDQYFPVGHASNSNTTVTIRIATQPTIDCPATGVDANIYEDNGVPVRVVRG